MATSYSYQNNNYKNNLQLAPAIEPPQVSQEPQICDHTFATAQPVSAVLATDPEWAVAEVVREPPQEDAMEDNMSKPTRKLRNSHVACVLFVVLAVGVGIGLAAGLGHGDTKRVAYPSSNAPAASPSNTPTQFPSQSLGPQQLGLDIDGEAGDRFGWSVAMSSDGRRIAGGARYGAGNAGNVRVLDWTGTAWVQLGSDIHGEASGDFFGYVVAMSSDGSRIVVGASDSDGNGLLNSGYVRVLDWTGTEWVQVGLELFGDAERDKFGIGVAMSSEGDRIAIGAWQNDDNHNGVGPGYVRVFDWTGTEWVQVGEDLVGEAAGDAFGFRVALSSDGNRIVAGAPYNNENGANSGHVRVFDWTGTEWVQAGLDLDGETDGDQFGYRVAMSSEGDRIAGVAPGGQVRVFDWTGTEWVQVALPVDFINLNGESVSARSLAMSSDGSRLAVGARRSDGTGQLPGLVRIFDWKGTEWEQVGVYLDGEASETYFGWGVAMSSEGNHIAVGAFDNDDNGVDSGRVRVFEIM